MKVNLELDIDISLWENGEGKTMTEDEALAFLEEEGFADLFYDVQLKRVAGFINRFKGEI
jgi:hypothetical protein